MKNFSLLALLSSLLTACASPPPATSETGVLLDVRQLTDDFDRAGEAYFSSDMGWIVFQATPKGETSYQMYVTKLKREWDAYPGNTLLKSPSICGTEEPIRVSPAGSKNTCGFFSPDGKSLIFASTGKSSAPTTQPGASAPGYQRSSGSYKWEFPAEMEIYRADGWEGAVVAAKDGATDLAQHALTHNQAYDAECAYSPDGNWIVFASNRTGDMELYIMGPDGSDVTQLTQNKGYDGGPFFSPDGKKLVYRSDRAENDLLQIYVADVVRDASGKITGMNHEKQLTKDDNVNWGPYWHPDGKHIIYATSAQGHQNYELYLMRADGSRKMRITFADGFDGLPVFSPDGRHLMWSSKRTKDGTTQVFVARFVMPAGA